MVKRITITIKPDVLRRIDNMVDGKQIRNRSHAIEDLISKALSKSDVDTAMILAGGVGAKLRPITYELPKAMIPIHGRPVLEHQIAMLGKYGINNIIVSLGHLGEKVRGHFGSGRGDARITYLVEKRPSGTAGALYMARDLMKDTFIVCNVDTLLDPNIPEIIEFHKRAGRAATMLLTTSGHTDKVGVARMRGNSITEFVEKPVHSDSKLVNAGFYVFEPGIKRHLRNQKGSLEKLVFPLLAKNGQLSGYVYDGPVFDVGFPAGYEKALRSWKDVS